MARKHKSLRGINKYKGYFVKKFLRSLSALGISNVTTTGVYNIPKEGGVLLVPNHRHAMDTPYLYGAYMRAGTGVGASDHKKLRMYLMANITLWAMNALRFNRKDKKQRVGVIRRSIRVLNDGGTLILFSGGQTYPGQKVIEYFEKGAADIAFKTGCPIVPVGITGTEDVMKRGIFSLRRPVTISFGKPMYPADYMQEGSKDEAISFINEVRREISAMTEYPLVEDTNIVIPAKK